MLSVYSVASSDIKQRLKYLEVNPFAIESSSLLEIVSQYEDKPYYRPGSAFLVH